MMCKSRAVWVAASAASLFSNCKLDPWVLQRRRALPAAAAWRAGARANPECLDGAVKVYRGLSVARVKRGAES